MISSLFVLRLCCCRWLSTSDAAMGRFMASLHALAALKLPAVNKPVLDKVHSVVHLTVAM